jgi:hypothetical protein
VGRARLARRLPLVLGAMVATVTLCFYVLLALRNQHVGFLADDALYLLMADAYSPWRNALGPVFEHLWRYCHLPPFYPLALALAGAGSEHLVPARIATAAFMAVAWLLCYAWLVSSGVRRTVAALLTLFCAWTPATLLYTIDLWSEGLYIALVLGCLLWLRAMEGTRPTVLVLVGLGLATGCAIATRSIGIALLPAVLFELYRQRPRAVLPVLAGVLLVSGALALLDMGDLAPSYGALMRDHYAADPAGALWRQLAAVAAHLPAAALYDLFLWREAAGWRLPVAGLLALCVGVGFVRELRHATPVALYTLAYVVIAWTWPFPEQTERLLFPLLPCAVFFAWRGVDYGGRRQWAGGGVALLLLVLAAPAQLATLARAATPVPVASLDSFRTTRYWLDPTRSGDVMAALRNLAAQERAASDAARLVPPSACIYTMNVQQVLLKARRPAFLPPRQSLMERGPPWGCGYFLLVGSPRPGFGAFYPLSYLQPHAKALAVWRLDDADRQAAAVALLMRVN